MNSWTRSLASASCSNSVLGCRNRHRDPVAHFAVDLKSDFDFVLDQKFGLVAPAMAAR